MAQGDGRTLMFHKPINERPIDPDWIAVVQGGEIIILPMNTTPPEQAMLTMHVRMTYSNMKSQVVAVYAADTIVLDAVEGQADSLQIAVYAGWHIATDLVNAALEKLKALNKGDSSSRPTTEPNPTLDDHVNHAAPAAVEVAEDPITAPDAGQESGKEDNKYMVLVEKLIPGITAYPHTHQESGGGAEVIKDPIAATPDAGQSVFSTDIDP